MYMHARAHTCTHTRIGNPTQASEQDHHSEKGPWTCSKQPDTTPDMHKSAGNQKGGCTSCSVGRSSRSRNRPGSQAEGGAVIKGPTQRIESSRLSSVTTAVLTAHILQIRLSGADGANTAGPRVQQEPRGRAACLALHPALIKPQGQRQWAWAKWTRVRFLDPGAGHWALCDVPQLPASCRLGPVPPG